MSVEFKDYYETLGVKRDADASEIKKAFRKLARKFHPDVADDKATAEQKFKEINEAYEVLGDPEKRKKYDQLGANWQQGPPPPRGGWQQAAGGMGGYETEFNFGGTGFSDFFEQYFSGASRYGFPQGGGGMPRGGGGGGSRRGGDIEGDILVTLDEAMHGSVRSISLQTTDPRTGKASTQTFQVRIPAGVTDGKRIRVPGEGEPGHGGAPAGDLYLRVRHAAHPDFHTEGADVYHDLELAPWEAVLGAEISVPTLDGSVKMRIPAGSDSGDHLRVRGRGFPQGKSGGRGDFYAVLHVQLPKNPSSEEKALWEKLRDASNFNPRR
ncbi:J domain-containing protein [Luteolibacter pohnpeiensis]|uniref:J domain-containing protein n=1 Tax=Luteolibacter pohnpeiensis TaxID=454153 RepID=A0A934VPX7_9BACT|nr:J domain-containing protein [Luteolibacter pohnpeiensis]MBK1881511.1 J domain-containing protein [Luteolibacter pohnpeiensis]